MLTFKTEIWQDLGNNDHNLCASVSHVSTAADNLQSWEESAME